MSEFVAFVLGFIAGVIGMAALVYEISKRAGPRF